MTTYDRLLLVKSDEKNDTGTPDLPRQISPTTDSKYVSARILMQTLNTVGSFLKSKMKEKMREDSVATSHCVFFFLKQM